MVMRNKKGQSALEFLTTYGWAFLVILIMIGALAYFGVLDPSRFLPDRCDVPAGFVCNGVVADATGETITMAVQNSVGKSIDIVGNAVYSPDAGNTCDTTGANAIAQGASDLATDLSGTPVAWTSQGELLFVVTCGAATDLNSGDRVDGTLTFDYTEAGSALTKTMRVGVSTRSE